MIAIAAAAAFFLMKGGKAAPPLPVVIPIEDIPPPPPNAPSYEPPPPCLENCADGYDDKYWDSREKILIAFDYIGYDTPPGDDATMNALGPDGELGGGDDVKSAEVEKFQRAYNRVSKGNKITPPNNLPTIGLLRPDGYMGPKTLNGLYVATGAVPDSAAGDPVAAAAWWAQISA